MSIRIDESKCNGCGKSPEALCQRICPGDLLYKAGQRVEIREVKDCWDCAACVKECPRQAIEMFLPVALGGRGATLTAQKKGSQIVWNITKPNGQQERIKLLKDSII